jgi:sporulation protein YlmC with PRC-barrel domain
MLKLPRSIAASSVAVCLALTAVHAAGQQQQKQQQATASQQRTQGGDRHSMAELRSGYSAEQLLDMDVRGSAGESVGSIENILVKNDRVTAIVIETNGFLDMFDTHFRIPWDQVTFGSGMDFVQVPLSERTLDALSDLKPEKVVTGPREWRVTEVIGDYATTREGRHYGIINDLIIGRDGAMKATVVTPSRAYGGGYYAYGWRSEGFDPASDTLALGYGPDELAGWERFDYGAYGIVPPRRTAQRGVLGNQAALRNGVSIERLLGMDVRGRNNNSIGEIDNVLVNAQGRISAVVIDSGGFLNIGETHFRVPWNQVQLTPGADYVSVPVAEDNIGNFDLFAEGVRTGPREWRVSELMDDYASLSDGMHYGVVQDLIASRDGALQAVVVGSRSSFGGGYHAFPFRAEAFQAASDTYALPYGRDRVAGLPAFRYEDYGINAPVTSGYAARTPTVQPMGATR